MRSLWKGSISFGLVHIPVRLYAATEDRRVSFHLLHRRCGTRVRYLRWCPHCRTELADEELVRAYEYAPDQYVVLGEEDLEGLPLPTLRTVEILDFVALEQIDPIYFERSYYLEPADGGARAYALLREAMRRTRRVAVGRVALRQKEALACLRVFGGEPGVLVLATMHYPDEVRPPEALAGVRDPAPVSERELGLAVDLIDHLTAPFEPGRYRDRYREALQERIEAKVRGREVTLPPQPEVPVADLLDALRASLERVGADGAGAPAGRAGDGRPVPGPA